MMTRYAVAFEVAGLLLTAALVGAIALAHGEGDDDLRRRGAGATDAAGATDGRPRRRRRPPPATTGRPHPATRAPAMSDDIPLSWFLYFAAAAFAIGLFGVLVRAQRDRRADGDRDHAQRRQHQPRRLLAVRPGRPAGEGPLTGVMLALFVITIAAAEVAVGIGLILLCYRRWKAADVDRYDSLAG